MKYVEAKEGGKQSSSLLTADNKTPGVVNRVQTPYQQGKKGGLIGEVKPTSPCNAGSVGTKAW